MKILVSKCLLGQRAAYHGKIFRSKMWMNLEQDLRSAGVEIVPLCPEMNLLSLPVPRAPLKLLRKSNDVRDNDFLRIADAPTPSGMTTFSNEFVRSRFDDWLVQQQTIAGDGNPFVLSGFIGKSKSPSCAAFNAVVFDDDGENGGSVRKIAQNEMGLFTRALLERFPGLPIESERSLQSIEAFLDRCREYAARSER